MSKHPLLTLICAALALLSFAPAAHASVDDTPARAVSVKYFRLSKTEAAKGEQVTASWSFTGAASRVTIGTAASDGVLLMNSWRARAVNAGELTFTVPFSLYTLSPLIVTLNVDGKVVASQRLIITCDNPWFFTPRPERCPSMPVNPSAAAIQEFEHGRMIWIADRDHIVVLYHPDIASTLAGRWETYEDTFSEGDAESDPSITAPWDKRQPARGFGKVWRNNTRVRDVLGWAVGAERSYTACFGGGFGGWKSFTSYLNDADGHIFQLQTYTMPTVWSVYEAGSPVRFTGCGE